MTDTLPPSTTPRPAPSRHPLAPLFSAGTVSLRCAQVLQSVRNNLSAHFRVDPAALQRLADQVQQQLHHHWQQTPPAASPDTGSASFGEAAALAAAPFWQRLQAGGTDRLAEFKHLLAGQPPAEQARAWADLAFIGVLMSSDPGPRWRCTEQHTLPAAAFAQAQADDLLALLDRAGKTALPLPQPAGDAAGRAAAHRGLESAAAAAGAAQDPAAPAQEPAPDPASTSAPAPAGTSAPASVPPQGQAAAPAAAPAPPAAAPAATRFGGPEGLAIATFRAFVAGAFSSDRAQPCRADAAALRHIDVAALRAMLQGTPQNPLQGLEGRAAVLARLGQLLQALPGAGGAAARPADLVAVLKHPPAATTGVQAGALLADLARAAAVLWPAPLVQGLPAGDTWQHLWAGAAVAEDGAFDRVAAAVAGTRVGAGADAGAEARADAGADAGAQASADAGAPHAPARPLPGAARHVANDRVTSGWVPLLAMPLALVSALAWPLARAGQPLLGLRMLAACADQPTSTLMMAAGVVVPRNPRLLTRSLKPGDEAIIECRALTVALFDELAAGLRAALQPAWGEAATELRMVQVVQAAAAVLAGDGAPALRVEGDGVLL